jgi:hypothetical protein
MSSFEMEKLRNFIKNPVKTLIDNVNGEVRSSNNKNNFDNNCNTDDDNDLKYSINKNINTNNTVNNKLFAIESFNHLNKDKLNEIIQKQKEQHERRIKALEKLTRLEKLQAEKLKKMLLLNKNNSISPRLYDSFFKSNPFGEIENANNIGNETTIDIDDTLVNDILNEEIKYSKKSGRQLDETIENSESYLKELAKSKSSLKMIKPSNGNKHHQVEVFNLKNTSVHEPLDGVVVIKESDKKYQTDKNSEQIRPKKTVSAPSFTFDSFNNNNNYDENNDDKHVETQNFSKPSSWSCPLPEENTSKLIAYLN